MMPEVAATTTHTIEARISRENVPSRDRTGTFAGAGLTTMT
jgi:hypothetical protein